MGILQNSLQLKVLFVKVTLVVSLGKQPMNEIATLHKLALPSGRHV